MFSAALQSGHLGPVVQQFQVGENAVNAAREVGIHFEEKTH